MQTDPQITFRGVEPSGSVEEVVRERIGKLERFYNRITSCNVIIDAQRHGAGINRSYHVTVDVGMPGHQVVVGRGSGTHEHNDVYVAVRDSFDAAQRQLEDVVRRMSDH